VNLPTAKFNDNDEERDKALNWPFAFGLVVAILLAYHPVWLAGFIWDDDKYVTHNPLLTGPDPLRRIWFSLASPSQYFPLTFTAFYFERGLWGLNPAGYHRINLFLHAANALLVWRLLSRLRVPGAWLAAAIWALHPVQVETVAWVTELKNLLMTFFYLLSLLAWIRFIDGDAKALRRSYLLALIFYALALFAKTTACTLPVSLLLILWFKKMPITRRRLAQIAPFVVMGLAMGLVTIWWERNKMGARGPTFAIGPLERILIASHALWFYAGKLLWPANLTFSYPRWTISESNPAAYVWLLATAGLGLAIWRTRRRFGRSVEIAAIFFALTLAPVLGFIMLVTFRYTFVADHYQYLACLGPIALVSAGIQQNLDRLNSRKPFLQPVLCAALLALLGVLTWRQCRIYSNEETLWRATVARNPASWMGENNLGLILAQNGETDEAIAHLQKSLELNPDNAKARNNLANALALNGNAAEAIAQFRKSLEIDPRDPETLNNLGNILALSGNVSEAIGQFRRALVIEPNNPLTLNNLAWWLATASDASLRSGAESVALAKKANQFSGGANPIILHTLAAAYAEAGRFIEASDTARLAEQLALEKKNDALARRLQQEIPRYETRLPMHEVK
jgi:Flp pilus assembly protein TadD